MNVDLISILNVDGKSLNISGEIDFSDKGEFDVSFPNPAKVEARFTAFAGSVSLEASVSLIPEYICDRCGTVYTDKLEFKFEEVFKKDSPENNDSSNPDAIPLNGSVVCLDEVVYKNIFINLPTKKLCTPDCKGLCPKCGKNLNEGDCGCSVQETDPRFDVLDKFFE